MFVFVACIAARHAKTHEEGENEKLHELNDDIE